MKVNAVPVMRQSTRCVSLNSAVLYEVRDFHSNFAEILCLVGCDILSLGEYYLTFQRIIVLYSSW